jgi:amino-acid N-acetyltransferase
MSAALGEIARGPARTAITALLERANLPTADLTDEHLEHFFFIGPRAAPTGLVGLEIHGRDALLRSLVVSPDHRAAGAGSALVKHAEAYASKCGVRGIYLLTTTAETFFARRGYARIARDQAPDSIRSTREFADICPASSALMVKHL